METQADSRWKDLLLAGVVTVLVPIIAFVAWPVIARWTAAAPHGVVLTYEVVADAAMGGPTVDMPQLTSAVDRLINAGKKRMANVRQIDDRRLEIGLLRPGDADVEHIEKLLKSSATLSFRVLASTAHDQAIIARAMADPAAMRVVDEQGDLIARWVPVRPGAEAEIAAYSDIARRTKQEKNRPIIEVLVVNDDCNLTGAYLNQTEAGLDRRGRPKLSLTFNTRGGRLFKKLTGSHLPDKTTNHNYKLGVILNGELCSAPLIVSTIYDYAQITGSFTKQETEDLASVLNTGALPTRLRLVAKENPP